MTDVRNVLSHWPDLKTVADECDLTKEAVEQWIKRGTIPPKHHLTLAQSAKRRGIKNVNLDYLATTFQAHQQ